MAEPGPLERIARKEQEIRARMLASRARADAIVADAEREAAALLISADERGEAEARELLDRETAAARASAERLVSDAMTAAEAVSGDTATARAVQLLVDAVLPCHPVPASRADVRAGGG